MTEGRRHALLIGARFSPRILEHPCFRIRCDYAQLSSDRDVDLVRRLLIDRFEFHPEDIRTLKTEEACRDAILAAAEELIERIATDDVVVLYYSGHGSLQLWPDGSFQETLVPYDSSRSPLDRWGCHVWREGKRCNDVRTFEPVGRWERLCGPAPGRAEHDRSRDILDSTVDDWVRRLNEKTPYVTLIFDCCNSGSLHRPPGVAREVMPDVVEGCPPPAARPAAARSAAGPASTPGFHSGWTCSEGRRLVMLAACAADELSWERRGFPRHGLFTYHLCRALREIDPRASWLDVLETVAPRVMAERPDQHPQIEGQVDRQVFGRRTRRARAYLPVVAVSSEDVDLWGGALHGVTRGSLWSIRPHGTPSRHQGDELARVEIGQVRPTTCRGRVVDGDPAVGLEAGQRAFLLDKALPSPGLRVVVEAPEERCRRLRELLADARILTAIDGDERGDADPAEKARTVTAYCMAPRPEPCPTDPFPALGPLDEPTWLVVDTAGRWPVRPQRDDPAGIELLSDDLVELARFEELRRLADPDPESPLHGEVELCLVGPHGASEPADPAAPEPAELVVDEGERIEIEIASRHRQTLWVSLVELDADHSISLVLPRRGHPEFRPGGYPLPPRATLRVAADYYREGGGLRRRLPDGFPWDTGDGDGEVGYSLLVLFVTPVPADFGFLERDGGWIVPGHPAQAPALVYCADAGECAVVLPPEGIGGDEHWTVVSRRLGVRRRPTVG